MNLSELEKMCEQFNYDWTPKIGDHYAWRESSTRTGRIHINVIDQILNNPNLIHGRSKNGSGERRYKSEVFYIPESVLAVYETGG